MSVVVASVMLVRLPSISVAVDSYFWIEHNTLP